MLPASENNKQYWLHGSSRNIGADCLLRWWSVPRDVSFSKSLAFEHEKDVTAETKHVSLCSYRGLLIQQTSHLNFFSKKVIDLLGHFFQLILVMLSIGSGSVIWRVASYFIHEDPI